jgi:hypothetical protein
MQTLNGKVLSVLKLQPYRKGDQADAEKGAQLIGKYWRLTTDAL